MRPVTVHYLGPWKPGCWLRLANKTHRFRFISEASAFVAQHGRDIRVVL